MESGSGNGSSINLRTNPSTNSSESEPFISEKKPEISQDPNHIHFIPNATTTNTTATPHSEESSTFLPTNDQTNSSMMEKSDESLINTHLEENHANPFGDFHPSYPNNSETSSLSSSTSQNPFLLLGDDTTTNITHVNTTQSENLHDQVPLEPSLHQPSTNDSSLGNLFQVPTTSTTNDSQKIVEHHDHDTLMEPDHWSFPSHEATTLHGETHASSSSQQLDPLFTLESTQSQQLENATDKNHEASETSTQQHMHDSLNASSNTMEDTNIHPKSHTASETSTQQHMHDSLNASSNTMEDTNIHPKSHTASETSTQQHMHDSLNASSNTMEDTNIHPKSHTASETSTQQHMHDSLNASSNTMEDTNIHPKSHTASETSTQQHMHDSLNASSNTMEDTNIHPKSHTASETSTQQHMHDSLNASSNTMEDTNIHPKSHTASETSTQQHMHDSLNASSNTMEDTNIHPKSHTASETSTQQHMHDSLNASSNTMEDTNIHLKSHTASETSTQQHMHESLNVSSNTKEDTKVHPKSQKDIMLASESSDDDIPISSMPKHEQQSSDVVVVPKIIKNPPIQIMERQEDPAATSSSSNRIPLHVFARNKSNNQWSTASNESLFSIQMGNMSFSNDMALLSKSGDLDNPIDHNHTNNMSGGFQTNHHPILPQPQGNKFNGISRNYGEQDGGSRATEEKAAETMRQVIMESSVAQESKKNKGDSTSANAAARSNKLLTNSNNDHSHHSDGSTRSYAFKVLTDVDKTISSKRGEDTRKQVKQSGQQNVKGTSAAPQNPKSTPNASHNKWKSCFTCCH